MTKVVSFKQQDGKVSVDLHEDGQQLIVDSRADGWLLSPQISQKAVLLQKGSNQLWIFSSEGVLQYD